MQIEKPFEIYRTKSKKKPFAVRTIGDNGEVLNHSQPLTTLANAYKNIYASARVVNPDLTDEEINAKINDLTL